MAKLTALDISPTALKRTQRKLDKSAIKNTKVELFDVRYDHISPNQDLVICSELLYYMDKAKLPTAIDRMVNWVNDDGYVVHAHAFEASERDNLPGFGWRQTFGATTISKTFSDNPQLQLDARIETDLYVVERFKKTDQTLQPTINSRTIDRERLEPSIEQQVLWNGYGTKPLGQDTITRQLPALCYHSIGSGAPEPLRTYQLPTEDLAKQLERLRYHGYRSASTDEVLGLVTNGQPIPGKAVHLTFDDGYKDFDSDAWPTLQAYGFTATLFVPTAHLGLSAVWDDMYGTALPLLDTGRLQELSRQGLVVGSHFTTHQRMTTLPITEVARGLRQSKSILEKLTGQNIDQLAYPYGASDFEIQRLARAFGYSMGYTTNPGYIQPFDRALGLNRIMIDSTNDPLVQLQQWPRPEKLPRSYRAARIGKRKARKLINHLRSGE